MLKNPVTVFQVPLKGQEAGPPIAFLYLDMSNQRLSLDVTWALQLFDPRALNRIHQSRREKEESANA